MRFYQSNTKALNKFTYPYPNPAKGGGLRKLPSLDGRGEGEGDYVNLFNSVAMKMKAEQRQDYSLDVGIASNQKVSKIVKLKKSKSFVTIGDEFCELGIFLAANLGGDCSII